MKILEVIPAFPPATGYGGAPIVAFEISKILADKGHDLTVFTTDGFDDHKRINSKKCNNYKFKIFYFKNLSNWLAHRYRLYLAPNFLIKGTNVKDYDIVHIHDFRTIPTVIIYCFCRIYEIPYILQPHGKPSIRVNQRGRILKRLFDLLIGHQIIKNAERILALNEDEAKIYSEISADNISIIHNGINKSDYILPDKNNFKKKFAIPVDYKIILYVGRINEKKGLKLLIESFANLSKKRDKLLLVLVGPDDGYIEYLKTLSKSIQITEKIIFTGFLNHQDKLAAYVDADVFVTPLYYGFPLTFLEAMICGVPIITSNKGDRISWIDEDIGVVTDYDSNSFEQAIVSILLDESSIKNRRKISEKIDEFTWDSVINKLEDIYLHSQ